MSVQFDFPGALQLAADLTAIADEVEAATNHRAKLRDVALDRTSFQGPYGVRHREFADTEDAELPQAQACADAAQDWATAWTSAVDEHNSIVEDEARSRMRQFNDARYQRWRILWINDPLGYHPYPPSGSVSPPASASTPTAPGFDGGTQFARYDFGPHDLDAQPTYHPAP